MTLQPIIERYVEHAVPSFAIPQDAFVLLSGSDLEEAAAKYREELERTVPAQHQATFESAQREILSEAYAWQVRFNKSLHARIRGYLELGRRCSFEYPWPVVAILGLCQVIDGFGKNRLYGLLGAPLARLGSTRILRAADSVEDILRRTNRFIFFDSVPTVLYALACVEKRKTDVGSYLLDGPLPECMDPESRELLRSITRGFGVGDADERFQALAICTEQHFAREQKIFSHAMGTLFTGPKTPSSWIGRKLSSPPYVPAPRIELHGRTRRLVFTPFNLPSDFLMDDHARRVELFTDAFVRSILKDKHDYRAALRYVLDRFS